MAEGMQHHVAVGVQREINVELIAVEAQIIVNRQRFVLRERIRTSVSVAARRPRRPQIASFIGRQPVVLKVAIRIDAVAEQRNSRSRLSPISIFVVSVNEAVRVHNRDDVPVNVQGHVQHDGIVRAQQLVQNVSRRGRCNPLASVDVRFDKNRAIVLQ